MGWTELLAGVGTFLHYVHTGTEAHPVFCSPKTCPCTVVEQPECEACHSPVPKLNDV